MVDIDTAGILLDEISEEIPPAFWDELNGGVSLLPDAKRSPEFIDDDLYVLGEYHQGSVMGRYIVLYYGSFQQVFGDIPLEDLRAELRETLLHEFTHHVESLAGERGLEIKDEQHMADYRRGKHQDL